MSKYLIIEDDENKALAIVNELIALGVTEEAITHVDAIKPALKEISINQFSLVILDLNIPNFSNKAPLKDGGLIVLEKIRLNMDKYITPNSIIGLTSYEELKEEQFDSFDALDFSLRSFNNDDWKQALKNKVIWDVETRKTKDRQTSKHIIISVHGIRTLGDWQDQLQTTINKSQVDIELKNYKYCYFSALQFLKPSSRKKIIDNFKLTLTEIANKYPESKITFISHSFGTYVLLKSLESLPISTELSIENLILVSSVVKSNYSWSIINNRFGVKKVINECGYNDNVLLASHYFSYGMGMAGRSGFVGVDIKNRYYKGGHAFFERENNFIEEYWLPIFNGQETDIDERNFGVIRENVEIYISSKLYVLFTTFALITLFVI